MLFPLAGVRAVEGLRRPHLIRAGCAAPAAPYRHMPTTAIYRLLLCASRYPVRRDIIIADHCSPAPLCRTATTVTTVLGWRWTGSPGCPARTPGAAHPTTQGNFPRVAVLTTAEQAGAARAFTVIALPGVRTVCVPRFTRAVSVRVVSFATTQLLHLGSAAVWLRVRSTG